MTRTFTIRTFAALAVAGLLGAGLLAAQKPDQADVLLQTALNKEIVEGDLKAAIEQYKTLAQNSDRAVAAKALVRMGACYEKLGLDDAQTAYQRVAREFVDQADSAAAARTRLAVLQSSATQVGQSVRLLVSDFERVEGYQMGAPSADGRYLSFSKGKDDGDSLGILDLKTGRSISITDPREVGAEVEASVISPDGRQAAYQRCGSRCELRVVQVNGGKAARSRIVHLVDKGFAEPHGWSPDGKSVVALRSLGESNQIAVISIADGSVRVLRDNVRAGGDATFSPDGRQIAYHAQSGTGTAVNRDIFVVTMDGRETRITDAPGDDRSPMWSPDGSHIVFVSDRTGSLSLWMIPVAGGTPTGPARLVPADVVSGPSSSLSSPGRGPFIPLGITRSGALYYVAGTGTTNVYMADLDANLKIARDPSIATNRYINASRAGVWSPDGQSLAYHATSGLGVAIRIRSVKTDDDREVPTVIPISGSVRWFPDGQSLLVPSRDVRLLNGQMGYYRVNIANGQAELLHQTPYRDIVSTRPDLSRDGKTIFYLETPQQPVRFDIDGRRETRLTPVGTRVLSLTVSPDGAQVAYLNVSTTDVNVTSVVVAPANGGEPREVSRFLGDSAPRERGDGLGLAWSPDQRHLFFVRPGRPSGIWRVPLAGGEAENIGVSMNRIRALRMHPSGNRITFDSVIDAPSEVWVLENFLPKPGSKR